MSLKEYTGEIILRADISRMKSNFPKISFEQFFDEITLKVMSDVHLTPSRALIYYDPRNTLVINIQNGSGVFGVKTNDSNIIK